MTDSTNALVSKWEEIPAARLENLMKSLARGVEDVKAAYQCLVFLSELVNCAIENVTLIKRGI